MSRWDLGARLTTLAVLLYSVLLAYGSELINGDLDDAGTWGAAFTILATAMMAGLFIGDFQQCQQFQEIIDDQHARLAAKLSDGE